MLFLLKMCFGWLSNWKLVEKGQTCELQRRDVKMVSKRKLVEEGQTCEFTLGKDKSLYLVMCFE